MSSRFQTAVLGSSLFYPNAVVWSDENLVAVASGSNVVILNPSNPGVRGMISIVPSNPFPVGAIDGGESRLDGCLLAHNLSRDSRPCVRSISWSPVGLANNASSLISICTAGGQVKLYRSPFCDFSAEWIEVVDISGMLFDYLKKTSFGEHDLVSSENLEAVPRQHHVDPEPSNDLQVSSGNRKRSIQSTYILAANDPDMPRENDLQIVPASIYEGKPLKKVRKEIHLPLLTARQYANRNAMLMSLTVAWSPIIRASECGGAILNNFCCSFLAVGGKNGTISLWRVNAPKYYSIDNPRYLGEVSLVGLFKAHDAWITAIYWASSGSDVSNSHFLLATGSSDGRVKIWQFNAAELVNSSEVISDSFPLLKEVITVDTATVSVLAITVQSQPPWKLFLAIGKGSGAFEVWISDIAINKFEKISCCCAHDCIVTGLAWAFDGHCLYSCSQDNSIKGWSLVENNLSEVPLPSSTFGVRSFQKEHYVFESCFGCAISPGNLAMAVARRYDTDLLPPMYEGRSHRAAVEFLWVGGQQFQPSTTSSDINNISVPNSHERDLICWENNILWSLNRYKDLSRILNVWDVVYALLAFKDSAPEFLDDVLLRWLASCFGFQSEISCVLSEATNFLPKLPTRQLQLINIICRRVALGEFKGNNTNKQEEEQEGSIYAEEQSKLWRELLLSSENDLLGRLVCFTFSALLNDRFNSSRDFVKTRSWSPDGWELMMQWISQNGRYVKGHSKVLAEGVWKIEKRRLQNEFEWEEDEHCIFCSAAVPFESKEYAQCLGFSSDDENVLERHRLERCAISMRILPAKPSWYCMCCQRRSTKLCPSILFTLDGDFTSLMGLDCDDDSTTPCCLFCGILLQRSQPEYSLSPCLV